MFHDVSPRPDYVALEEEVLQLWAETHAFERLREQTQGGSKWSFLDGPITANNPMGVHHAWGRTYKDVYNRYHAMLGHELRWQQGFDCQGLWVEVEVEKSLGFKNKRQIEAFGVDNFVNMCKDRVHTFAAVQTEQSKRLGYWMDWNNSYYTHSDENNYGIWSFLKLCHERGWLYRGHDVMPWCPRCGTALSEHEIATEGYVEKTHLALTVAFALVDREGEALLAWTTTPWTLPANVAAAVHPELTYVRVETTDDGRRTTNGDLTSYWLVKEALPKLNLHPSSFILRDELPGSALVGWRYTGPFDELDAQSGVVHQVVAWGEVSADEGTGVVHVAPGAGKEDFALGQELGLAVLAPLDDDGVYVAGYGWLSGQRAADVPEQVADALAERGLVFHREMYTHRYPVCWRCGTELVFRLVDEWLIRMDELRHQMMDAAREATWVPAFGLERELDWLRSMDDWMISKRRYWGLALPFYPCDGCGHVTVVGSRDELRERAIVGWEDFDGQSPHRPWVDAVEIACEHCGQPVARVPDVGNVWLDGGIVAFATLHYREDRAYWREWFPADLVLESFPGQFRNWFYALLAMSTALEGHAPFKTLLGYATVNDEHGNGMHKSKGNSIPFEVAANWMGVEPLRWMYASAPLERNLNFGRGLIQETARRLQPLWEVYRFFVTYANLEATGKRQKEKGKNQTGTTFIPAKVWRYEDASSTFYLLPFTLDRWLLARIDQLVAVARERLGSYDVRSFTAEVELFVDDLSNWYVRRSRRRFWGTDQSAVGSRQSAVEDQQSAVGSRQSAVDDNRNAFSTLYVALVTLARVLAPVLPFLGEALYQNLVRSVDPDAPVSVHLTGYPVGSWQSAVGSRQPQVGKLPTADCQLLTDMDLVRRVASLGRVARKGAGLRVRQPLGRMLVAVTRPEDRAALERLEGELLDELNIKRLEILDAADGRTLQRYRVRPNLRLLGPQLGKQLPAVRAVLEALEPIEAAVVAHQVAQSQPVTLLVAGEGLILDPEALLVETLPLEGFAVAQEGGLQVALDTRLDDDLRREGLARDLVRAVQEARKQAGLALSDRIALYLLVEASVFDFDAMLEVWGDYLRSETLTVELYTTPPPADVPTQSVDLENARVRFAVARR